MIAQAIDLVAFAAVGAAIGALYAGRLWFKRHLPPRLSHPMLWLLAGTFARLGLVLAAFLLVQEGQWARLAACLLGLVAAWLYLHRRAGRSP